MIFGGDNIHRVTQLLWEGEALTDDVKLLQAGLTDKQGEQLTNNVEELSDVVVYAAPDRDTHRRTVSGLLSAE